MIKISPHVPCSRFCLIPIPQGPCLLGGVIHILHIPAVVEFCKLRVSSEISLAQLISCIVTCDITASHWQGHWENSSSPAVIVASVDYSKRSSVIGNGMVGASCSSEMADTKYGQGLRTGLISYKRVAVVARESASPIVFIAGKYCSLKSDSLILLLNGWRDSRNKR